MKARSIDPGASWADALLRDRPQVAAGVAAEPAPAATDAPIPAGAVPPDGDGSRPDRDEATAGTATGGQG